MHPESFDSSRFPNRNLEVLMRIAFVATVTLILLSACSTPVEVSQERVEMGTSRAGPVQRVRLAIVNDSTGSSERNVIPPLTVEHVETLLDELLAPGGGEVRFWSIRDVATDPARHCFFEPIPAGSVPTPKPTPSNPIERKFAEHEARAEARNRRNTDPAARARVLAGRGQEVADCLTALKPSLAQPRSCGHSDMRAVLQAMRFLMEPGSDDNRLILFLVTDGEHTGKGIPGPELVRPDRDSVEVVLVNQSGEMGVIAPLDPHHFGTVEAAIRFVIQGEVDHGLH